jgi:lysophospholipase L1-like esterase
MIQNGNLILFQGDSITDAGRARDIAQPNAGLGTGYAYLVAAHLLAARPADDLRFMNRGISGNRIVDLYARWREDALNLQPNLISILIGINDTWHEFSRQAGVAVPKFERVYRQLLTETREALPNVKLVLCEPFALPCGAVTREWIPDVEGRQAVTRKLAGEFGATLVEFQKMFDRAQAQAAPAYWAGDGVHPTYAGHQRMAEAWLAATGAQSQ